MWQALEIRSSHWVDRRTSEPQVVFHDLHKLGDPRSASSCPIRPVPSCKYTLSRNYSGQNNFSPGIMHIADSKGNEFPHMRHQLGILPTPKERRGRERCHHMMLFRVCPDPRSKFPFLTPGRSNGLIQLLAMSNYRPFPVDRGPKFLFTF